MLYITKIYTYDQTLNCHNMPYFNFTKAIKSLRQRINYIIDKLITIEKNPGPLMVQSEKTICASYSQGDVRIFGLNAGTQCVAMSFCYLLFIKKNTIVSSTMDLDKVLHLGNELYSFLFNSCKQAFLMLTELPSVLYWLDSMFEINYSQSYTNTLNASASVNVPFAVPLKTAIEILINEMYCSFLLTIGCNTVAINLIENSSSSRKFNIFDSHARDVQGFSQPQGTCVLLEVNGIDNLVEYFQTVSEAGAIYELKGLKITIVSNCNGTINNINCELPTTNINFQHESLQFSEGFSQETPTIQVRKKLSFAISYHALCYSILKPCTFWKSKSLTLNSILVNSQQFVQKELSHIDNIPDCQTFQQIEICGANVYIQYTVSDDGIFSANLDNAVFRKLIADNNQNSGFILSTSYCHVACIIHHVKRNVAKKNKIQYFLVSLCNDNNKIDILQTNDIDELISMIYECLNISSCQFDVQYKINFVSCSVNNLTDAERRKVLAKHLKRKSTKAHSEFEPKCKHACLDTDCQRLDMCIERFHNKIREGPFYICTVCHRMLYKRSVVNLQSSKFELKHLFTGKKSYDNHEYICKTCKNKISQKKTPCQAVYNKLAVDDTPPDLLCLEKLEQILIAQRIVFQKIVVMAKGQQRKVKGAICNVPVECVHTSNVLPRPPTMSGIILVKLKRKLQYRGHVYFQPVRPNVVLTALLWLKNNNTLYNNIEIDLENIDANVRSFNDEPNHSQNEPVLQSNMVNGDDTEETDDDPLLEFRAPTNETCLQSNIPDYPVQVCNVSLGNEIYDIAPGENKHPVSCMTDILCEELAFPVLFPKGRFGYKVEREVKLSPVKYFNARLLHYSGKFASNPEYLFFAQFITEQKKVSDSINIALTKLQGQSITASNLKSGPQHLKNLIYHDQAYLFLRQIPGTPPYWQKFMYEVLAMIKQLGIPTWFMTLSCADLRWNELFEIIAKLKGMNFSKGEIEKLSYNERCSLLNHNPVIVAKHFQYRVENFFTEVLLSSSNPIGKITYYALRIEFQMRGSPHLHALIWTSDCPKLSHDTKKDYVDFIDSHVQAFLPDKELDSELHDLVYSYQKHSHSKTCRKYKNVPCRFNFGQFFTNETIIAEPLPESMDERTKCSILDRRSNILSCVKENIDKSLNPSTDDYNPNLTEKDILSNLNITENDYYAALSISADSDFELHLKRPKDSCFINNYFVAGLKGFQANVDLQPVFNHYKCVTYVCSYFTKDETECSQAIMNAAKEAKSSDSDTRNTLRKVGAAFLSTREVSSQECAYRCMPELWLKKTFPASIFISTDIPEKRIRIAKSKQELDVLPDDSTDIFKSNIIHRYSLRPISIPQIASLCLAQFASYYYKECRNDICETADAQPIVLTDDAVLIETDENDVVLPKKITLSNKEKMKCRNVKSVIRYHTPSKQKEPERYFHHLLFLYYPWTEENSLVGKNQSYESKYHEPDVQIVVEQNRSLFEPNGDAVIEALQSMREHSQDLQSSLDAMNDQENADISQDFVDNTRPDESFNEQQPSELASISNQNQTIISSHTLPSEITDDDLRQSVRGLNEMQRHAFNIVLSWSRNTVKNKNSLSPQEIKPLNIFISGAGGTGKSHLIRTIYHLAHKTFRYSNRNPDLPTVILMAPTGVAAINISGTTINTALAIPKNAPMNLPGMSDQTKTQMRLTLKELKLIIIDEISMVSNCTLLHIHQRLKDIFGTVSSQMFAGLGVLIVGDFYQLPPIKSRLVFEPYKNDIQNLFHLWQLFELLELTEIMRQRNAREFIDILNRFRTASQTKKDLDDINARLVNPTDPHYPSDALHIWAENAPVTSHNMRKLDEIDEPLHVLKAIDRYPPNVNQKDIDMVLKRGRSETGGLDFEIHIKKGARVMLTTNIDIKDRLINGQMGIIYRVQLSPNSNKAATIFIKFDDPEAGRHLIEKHSNNQLVSEQHVVPIEPILTKIKLRPNKPSSPVIQRIQFPIALSWACTIHKVQGLTLDNVVISFELIKQRAFNFGQIYVALSRSRSLEGIRVLSKIESKHVKANPKVDAEYERLRNESSINSMADVIPQSDHLKICLLNIRSLRKHHQDMKLDQNIFDCDVVALTETHLLPQVDDENIRSNLKPFTLYRQDHYTDKYCSLAICYKHIVTDFEYKEYFPSINGLKFSLISQKNKNVLHCLLLYKKNNVAVTEFTNELSTVLSNNHIHLVFGDFNVNFFNDQEARTLKMLMQTKKYVQLVQTATFISSGTLLDHVYVLQNFQDTILQTSVVSVYYSDHDSVKIIIQM